MKPYLLHSAILTVLAIPGGILLVQSLGTEHSEGMFSAHNFLKVFWIVYGLYVLFSTLIVCAMHLVMRLQKRKLKGGVIILAHVVPVGVLWVGVQLGIHDIIEDRLKTDTSLDQDDRATIQKTSMPQKTGPLSAPMLKKRDYQQPGEIRSLESTAQEGDK